jgi:prolyl-tRNA editing enzyme YbaK/EbsC (Cys-tRNA(Pro) deacylase)
MKTKTKTCKCCGVEKPLTDFTHKNSRCNVCLEAGKTRDNEYQRFNENLEKLSRMVRYKNARRITGYKFNGVVPEPKEPAFYIYAD